MARSRRIRKPGLGEWNRSSRSKLTVTDDAPRTGSRWLGTWCFHDVIRRRRCRRPGHHRALLGDISSPGATWRDNDSRGGRIAAPTGRRIASPGIARSVATPSARIASPTAIANALCPRRHGSSRQNATDGKNSRQDSRSHDRGLHGSGRAAASAPRTSPTRPLTRQDRETRRSP